MRSRLNVLGCRARIGLNIDTPDGRIKVECLERSLATEDLELINPLVTAIVTCIGETLRVLVREDGAIRLHRCTRSQVLCRIKK
jgi:hypothetical protein